MKSDAIKIIPLGDSALVVRLRDDLKNSDETLALVLQTIERLREASLPSVSEIAPAFTSVGVFFDPVKVAAASGDEEPSEWLATRVRAALGAKLRLPAKKKPAGIIEIPVCYASVFAPDLQTVAEHSGLSEAEIVRRYNKVEYRVQCIGFAPGFAYLSGLAPELATPRLATPRKQVPIGSVAIGAALTGVYPQVSPGGWNIIGRTPLRMFDVTREPASILQTGDRVRFRPITLEEFTSLQQ